MSIKYLITPSLLGSYKWYLLDESTDAREKFLNTLAKIKTETTPSQQKGLDFEDKICELDKMLKANWSDSALNFVFSEETEEYKSCLKNIAEIVKGGLWQQSVKKEIKVGNQELLLYGRTDVIKRDTVFDIKFTGNYELGKFQDSSQHLIYLYCSDLPKFSYLISDGKDWWREDYFNHAGIESEIKSKVSEFLDYLERDKEAKELYFNNWISR